MSLKLQITKAGDAPAAALAFFLFLTSQFCARAAVERVASQFTDGDVFSVVLEEDNHWVFPIPNVHAPLAGGSVDNWLLLWRLSNLQSGRRNPPDRVVYLARQPWSGEWAYGFRANGSIGVIACDAARAVELYNLRTEKQATLLNSMAADDPAVTPPPARLFSRSEKYLFLWKPAPTIYAVSNFNVVKQLAQTDGLKKFAHDLQMEGGWEEALTDDLKYLVHVPLEYTGASIASSVIDRPHCYNLESGAYSVWTMQGGTNGVEIVAAESVGGALQFLAFWGPPGARHLGVLDKDSKVLAELPITGTHETQFWRNASWDYAHSRFLIRNPDGDLVIYNYQTKAMQHFTIASGPLRRP